MTKTKGKEPEIQFYFHCKECLDELPPNTSPSEYTSIEVGVTATGLMIWCKRHNKRIAHIVDVAELVKNTKHCACARCNDNKNRIHPN